MRNPFRLLAAATLLLRATSAAPPPQPPPPLLTPELLARAPEATATGAWVTVDKSGVPATVTPVVTVDGDGAATTISAAPNELTATVVTKTEWAEVTTSTGTTAPGPTAKGKHGAGSFLVCDNADGPYAPFCQPTQNSSLYPGTTYYVTWDSTVFASPNTSVIVEGSYVNATSGEITSQAFSSPEIEAGWSYYAWKVETSLLQGTVNKAVNITLVIRALAPDSNATAEVHAGPTVVVARSSKYEEPAPGLPTGAALYIGLPAVLGFCVLMLCGVCAWNRKARRIGLGNIMSRGRNKYGTARGRVSRRMTMRRERKQAIRLSDHGGPEEGNVGVKGVKRETMHYRDDSEDLPPRHQSVRYEDDGWGQDWESEKGIEEEEEYQYKDRVVHVGIARRDSDALGSLAGTPTSERFPTTQKYGRH